MKSWEINIYSLKEIFLTKILVICIINILVLPIANSKSEKQRIRRDKEIVRKGFRNKFRHII